MALYDISYVLPGRSVMVNFSPGVMYYNPLYYVASSCTIVVFLYYTIYYNCPLPTQPALKEPMDLLVKIAVPLETASDHLLPVML
jgi:hypothetical protein